MSVAVIPVLAVGWIYTGIDALAGLLWTALHYILLLISQNLDLFIPAQICILICFAGITSLFWILWTKSSVIEASYHDPIIILLAFFAPVVDSLLLLGYRKKLVEKIAEKDKSE